MDLQVPVPTIDSAVSMRNLSILKDEGQAASQLIDGAINLPKLRRQDSLKHLKHALYASMVITFAQGFNLLQCALKVHAYDFQLEEVARIWWGAVSSVQDFWKTSRLPTTCIRTSQPVG